MSLLDVLRAGVAVANTVTKPLQATVSYERFGGTDAYGSDTWLPARPMTAVCEWTEAPSRTGEGILTVARATLTFLDIAEMVAATDGLGLTDHDKLTLPDGTTGPILGLSGFIDAGTGHPIATEVSLG